MTTITHEQFEAARRNAGIGLHVAEGFLHDLGFTVAPPEPPAAMVKLAREAVIAAAPVGEWQLWEAGYLAALQHAAKVVMDLPQAGYDVDVGGDTVSRVHILQALGAEQ